MFPTNPSIFKFQNSTLLFAVFEEKKGILIKKRIITSWSYTDQVDEESKSIDRSLKAWLETLSPEQRAQFVDNLYEALVSTNAKTLSELSSDKTKLVKAWNSMDAVSRANLLRCINLVFGKKNQKPKKGVEIKENE